MAFNETISSVDDFVMSINVLIDNKVNDCASNAVLVTRSASWNLVELLFRSSPLPAAVISLGNKPGDISTSDTDDKGTS
jgi:hypothetical protein